MKGLYKEKIMIDFFFKKTLQEIVSEQTDYSSIKKGVTELVFELH